MQKFTASFIHILQIVDFGFSKDITSRSLIASSVGSLLYSSPEIVEGKPYKGPECDVWSLGVILYTMLTATMPFDDGNMGDFIGNITNGNYPDPIGVSDCKYSLPIIDKTSITNSQRK